METRVLESQSLFDIAVQESGSVEGIFDIAGINEIALTDELIPGAMLENGSITDRQVYDYYKIKDIKPATALDELEEGIEFWAIEWDFVVS